MESAHHVKACRWSTAARSVTLEAIAALAVNCVFVRSPVPLVVAIGVAHSEARNHELANNGNWAALAVLEHAYAAAAGRRDLDAHALWRAEAAVAMPGACNLFRREQLRSLLSMAHGGSLTTDEFARRGGALSWTSSRGGAITGAKGCDRNVEVATPAAKPIERIGARRQNQSRTFTSSTDAPRVAERGSRRRLYAIHWPRARQPARTGAWPGGGWQAWG